MNNKDGQSNHGGFSDTDDGQGGEDAKYENGTFHCTKSREDGVSSRLVFSVLGVRGSTPLIPDVSSLNTIGTERHDVLPGCRRGKLEDTMRGVDGRNGGVWS